MSERAQVIRTVEIGGYSIEVRLLSDCPYHILDGLSKAISVMFEVSKKK